MNLRQKIAGVVAAGALAAGVATVTPAPAAAGPEVAVPVVVAIGIGTFALGVAIANSIANSKRGCTVEWFHIDGKWQRVVDCD